VFHIVTPMGIDHGGDGAQVPQKFGVEGTLMQTVPPDFVI